MKNIFGRQEVLISCSSLRNLPQSAWQFVDHPKGTNLSEEETTMVLKRLKAVSELKAKNISQRIIRLYGCGRKTDINKLILEILLNRNYRSGTRESNSPDFIHNLISNRTKAGEPIELTISLFPCKIPNLLKTAGPLPDFADFASLIRLREIALAVKEVYPPGAKVIILTDGNRFQKLLGFLESSISEYQKVLMRAAEMIDPEGHLVLRDYMEMINALPLALKTERQKLYNENRQYYEQLFGPQIDLRQPLVYLQKLETEVEDKLLAKKFISLFSSLIYSIYISEIMESKNPQVLTLAVFKDIFNFNTHDQFVNRVRQNIVTRTWEGAISYIAEITTGRMLKPVEYFYPNSIRCDMHNIIDRLTLYPVNRSTKLTSFHGTGFANAKGEVSAKLRVLLENGDYVPVFGSVFGHQYREQPLFYLHRQLYREGSRSYLAKLLTLK